MVDSINPTGKNNNNPDEQPTSNTEMRPNAFYRGFGRPENTKVNLVAEHVNEAGTKVSPAPEPPKIEPVNPLPEARIDNRIQGGFQGPPIGQTQPIIPPQPVKNREPIVWRSILIVLGGGLVITIILGAGSYLGFGYYYKNKLNDKNKQLDDLKTEKNNLLVVPVPLELPQQTAPTDTSAPVNNPTPTQPQPIEEEKPATPPLEENGGQAANG